MPLLTCPHCGSSLSAPDPALIATRCPVCGGLLSVTAGVRPGVASGAEPLSQPLVIREAQARDLSEEDDSATRPVAPELLAPILAEAVTAHSAPHLDPTPRDETTKALPDALAPDPAPDATHELPLAAQPQPPRSPWRGASLLLALAILIVVAVVVTLLANGVIVFPGTGAQPTATAPASQPTATATPTSQQLKIGALYQVTYPRNWNVQQRNDAPRSYYALLTAPTSGASVNIAAQQTANAPTPSDLNMQYIRALAQSGTTPTIDQAPPSVTFDGEQWTPTYAEVTLQGAAGQPTRYSHVVALSVVHGAYIYTIVTLAPTDSATSTGLAYDNAVNTYFNTLLASFAFLS